MENDHETAIQNGVLKSLLIKVYQNLFTIRPDVKYHKGVYQKRKQEI